MVQVTADCGVCRGPIRHGPIPRCCTDWDWRVWRVWWVLDVWGRLVWSLLSRCQMSISAPVSELLWLIISSLTYTRIFCMQVIPEILACLRKHEPVENLEPSSIYRNNVNYVDSIVKRAHPKSSLDPYKSTAGSRSSRGGWSLWNRLLRWKYFHTHPTFHTYFTYCFVHIHIST